MKSLQQLHLEFNQFTGTLTPNINQLTDLKHLSINNNRLTGKFPYIEGLQNLGTSSGSVISLLPRPL
jgi:hypothetical protein